MDDPFGGYIVEDVVQSRNSTMNGGTQEFLVKWKGYDNCHNTWEAGSDLISSPKLKEFKINDALQSSGRSSSREQLLKTTFSEMSA